MVAIYTTGCTWRKRQLSQHALHSDRYPFSPQKSILIPQIAMVEIAKSKQEIATATPNPAASRCWHFDRTEDRALSPTVVREDDGCVILKSWELCSRLATDVHHRPGWRHTAALSDVMPLLLATYCMTNKLRQFVI